MKEKSGIRFTIEFIVPALDAELETIKMEKAKADDILREYRRDPLVTECPLIHCYVERVLDQLDSLKALLRDRIGADIIAMDADVKLWGVV